MSAVELTVLPVSDQCKGLLGIDSMFWWRLRSKCSPLMLHLYRRCPFAVGSEPTRKHL